MTQRQNRPADSVQGAPARRARKGHGRVTLHDIAARAGVTRITVSRYLRTPDKVAPETARRIQAGIDALAYVPNHQAGQLASGRSRLIAALIPHIGHSIFAETIQGLSEGLAGSGYELLLMSTGYSLAREAEQLRALLGWSPAAVIVTGRRHHPSARRLLQQVGAAGTPLIQLWDYQSGRRAGGVAQVGFNHQEVGRQMARHLLAGGHRELAFIDSSVEEDFRAHERAAGFVQAARAARARAWVLRAPAGDAFDAGRAVLRLLREQHPGVSAAAFANDHLACGALLEAQALGLAVPRQMALLGFGDFPIGRQLTPALSTVRPPRAEIGRAAAELALHAVGAQTAPADVRLACELVQRASTIAARARRQPRG